MREYARQRGLQRLLVRLPVLTPRLSSLWLGLVTPLNARIGRKLIESLPHETIVRDPRARERFPIRPRGYREAIVRALVNEEQELAATRWSDAFSVGERAPRKTSDQTHGRLFDTRVRRVAAPPANPYEHS
jgi:hypothetical protein